MKKCKIAEILEKIQNNINTKSKLNLLIFFKIFLKPNVKINF